MAKKNKVNNCACCNKQYAKYYRDGKHYINKTHWQKHMLSIKEKEVATSESKSIL